MSRLLRFLRFCLFTLLGLVAVAATLLGWFVYSPDPPLPQVSGILAKGVIEVGALKRSYSTYVPRGLPSGAPLVVVMHGSGESGAQIRLQSGYGFERLADRHGFAVVYPNASSFDWNDCSRVGDFSANGVEVDDVRFLAALVDRLIADIGVDRTRVFATGVSAGGFMALRLALEAPARFRAVASVAANLPTPDNFKCEPVAQATSVMLMNGTDDPLVPFAGGEVSLFGLFYQGGRVRSSRESARYFATRNRLADAPAVTQTSVADGVRVEHVLWRSDSALEVELVAIHGGGHGLPQRDWRRPRLLGPSPMAPDGPALIWAFFERQRR